MRASDLCIVLWLATQALACTKATVSMSAHDAGARDASVRDAGARDASVHDGGPAPSGPVTGRACRTPAECGAGYDCNAEVPGGYCMVGAAGGAMACRDPQIPCPADTVCSPLPWHQISGVCLRPCDAASPCREGYFCNYLQAFPGDPSGARSPVPVCWTVCQPGTDQSCNDSPIISSLHGTCEANGTCTCHFGAGKNPSTGRCL